MVTNAWSAAPTYLIAIGNNAGTSDEVELLYAQRDARQITRVFQELGEVSGKTSMLLVGEDAPTVRSALLDLNARIRASGETKAKLFVFYSGHADSDSLHLGNTRLRLNELRAIVKGSSALVRLLIIDACRSGAVTRVKGVKAAPLFKLTYDTGQSAQGFAILTSSSAGENSQESDRLRASFFSHHLVSGLRGAADKNLDGQVTIDEAYQYTYAQTLKSSGRSLELQHPTFEYGLKGKGGVVLTRSSSTKGRTGRLQIKMPGLYLISEGSESGPIAMEVAVKKGGTVVALPHRRYFVQRRGLNSYREYQVTVSSLKTAILDTQQYKVIDYDRLVRKGGSQRRAVHGLTLMGGFRGQRVSGVGVTSVALAGYSMDFPSLSLGVRVGFSQFKSPTQNEIQTVTERDWSLSLIVQKFIDFESLSISLGILVEGLTFDQRFETRGDAPDRRAFGLSYGAILGLETKLWSGTALRLEGGPRSYVFEQAIVDGGEMVDEKLQTPLTWTSSMGLVIRL
jgi:hypothetical protein